MTQVALVQGASRGIGLALVEALLERGEVARVVATSREPQAAQRLAELRAHHGDALLVVPLDVRDERTIAAAAAHVADACGPELHWVVNCAGLLHDGASLRPERSIEQVDAQGLANLSARVGSIADNRLGGWYGYRAAKTAQNMFTRTLSIELARRAPNVICLALHPGTVDTDLSRPFQASVPADRLFDPPRAARQLLQVIDAASPQESGRFLAWDGSLIPW
jgi:NAD(P)-dependent dehydrogenase (short-subunit alcohol dehydrogenase family)